MYIFVKLLKDVTFTIWSFKPEISTHQFHLDEIIYKPARNF